MFKTVFLIPLFVVTMTLTVAKEKSTFEDFEVTEEWNGRNISGWTDTTKGDHCYTNDDIQCPEMCWERSKNNAFIKFKCIARGSDDKKFEKITIFIGDSAQDSKLDSGEGEGDIVAKLEIRQLEKRHINQVFKCQLEYDLHTYSLEAMKLIDTGIPESPVFLGVRSNPNEINVTIQKVIKCRADNARFDSILEIGSGVESLNKTSFQNKSEENNFQFQPLQVEYTTDPSHQYEKIFCEHKYMISERKQTKNITLIGNKKRSEEDGREHNDTTEKPRGPEGVKAQVVVAAVVAAIAVTLVTGLTWMFFRRQRLRRYGERRPLRSESEEVLRGTGRSGAGGARDEYANVLPRIQRRPSCARNDLYAAVVPKSKRLQNAEANYSEPYDHVPDQPYMDIGSDLYESMSGSEYYAEPSREPRYANEPCGDADSVLYAVPSSVADGYVNAGALRSNNGKSAPNPVEPLYSEVRPRVAPKPHPRRTDAGTASYVVMK